MTAFPPIPELPAAQQATAQMPVRYEDIAQDGRVRLAALAPSLGEACWRPLLARHPLSDAARQHGIIPILSRLVLEGAGGPVSVHAPLQAHGRYQLAHTVDEAGEVDRLILNLYTEVEGPRDRTHGPPPEGAGEPVRVGRVYAEHVFTRPFAPPGERRVRELPGEASPAVPPQPHTWEPAHATEAVPPDAQALEPEARLDPVPLRFGLTHTDSNRHVNSLVYPRCFEEAALRRFAELAHPSIELARWAELAFRKPCFAGDEVRIRMRAFALGDRLGTAGAFVPAQQPATARAHTYARLIF